MEMRAEGTANNRSVSYIVTMNVAMADFARKKRGNYIDNMLLKRVCYLLNSEMEKRGQPLVFENADLLIAAFHFEKDKDCLYDRDLSPDSGEVDYFKLSDERMWAYIYGEFFVNGRLSAELKGFGAVQAPRDKAAFAAEFAAVNPCDVCQKCPPEKRKHALATA